MNFWAELARPIIGLAPMDGISDHPFRHIQKKYGNPALVYTEFASVDGLCHGDMRLMRVFHYDEGQRPIVAQIYGLAPNAFYQAAILLCQLGFDGIDINMGCPARRVTQRGAGAGLIQTPALAQAIVTATQAGVRAWLDGATVRDCPDILPAMAAHVEALHAALPTAAKVRRPKPVSVKTRIGYDEPAVDSWLPHLLTCAPAAIALHGRTLSQAYTGRADWDAIGRAGELARAAGVPLLGNGDVASLADARQRVVDYGVDGVLVGRASYGNPWVFRPAAEHPRTSDPYRLLHIALEHAQVYESSFRGHARYHFLPMRKHMAWYIRDLPGAKRLRRALTATFNVSEARAVIEEYLAYRREWETGASGTTPIASLAHDSANTATAI